MSEEGPLRSMVLSLRSNVSSSNSSNNNNILIIQVLLSVAAGVLLSGYLCFAIGSILAFEATRATVRVLGGYRWEWMRFLNDEIHQSYRICRAVPQRLARASTSHHPLTGKINGYRVEYAYRFPYNNNHNDDDNRKEISTKNVPQNQKRVTDIRRVICAGDSRRKNTGYNLDAVAPSASYYQNEVVRSLSEYIQREKYKAARKRLSKDRNDTSDDTSGSSDDSSNCSDSDSYDNAADDDDDRDLLLRRRKNSLPRTFRSPHEVIDSFLVPIDAGNTNNKTEMKLHLGVPLGYWKERRRELLAWAMFVEPAIAFFGMYYYLVGCFLHALLTCPIDGPVLSHAVRTTTATKTFSKSYLEATRRKEEYDLENDNDDDNDEDQTCYTHVRNAMIVAVVAMVLMVPYCILEARSIQRKRMQFWKKGEDPLAYGRGAAGGGSSEIERLRNALRYFLCFGQDGFQNNGRYFSDRKHTRPVDMDNGALDHSWKYYARRESLYAPSFVVGTLLLWWGCGPITLAWANIAVYCMVQWIHVTSPIQSEILERFRSDPCVVANVPATVSSVRVANNNLSKGGLLQRKVTSYFPYARDRFVRIRYAVPSLSSSFSRRTNSKSSTNKNQEIVVVKDIQSEELYMKCEANPTSTYTTSIHIDPNFPLSGYPTTQLDRDISNSWGILKWQFACFVTLWCYLVSACSALDILDVTLDEDYDDPFQGDPRGPEDLCIAVILILSGFGLLLPGASILRQNEHDRFLLNAIYEPTQFARARTV